MILIDSRMQDQSSNIPEVNDSPTNKEYVEHIHTLHL